MPFSVLARPGAPWGDYQTVTSTGKQCKAMTAQGQRCAAWTVNGSDFCFWHDPKLAQERKRARSAGGRARHARKLTQSGDGDVCLSSVADVVVLLERTARDLLALENSISRARAVAYVASVGLKALEVAELEERLTRLEEQVSNNGRLR